MKKEEARTEALLDLSHSIAAPLFAGKTYPWEVLSGLSDFIREAGAALSEEEYLHPEADVWIHKTAVVFPSAYIAGPCIIGAGTEVRHCAFIRGSVLIGEGCVIGNSTELKNALIFDKTQVPHYNYVGDAVLGYHAHMGAGSITSNVKGDKSPVKVHCSDGDIETGRKKFGAVLGDYAEIGCGSVLNPGTVIGRNTQVYPLSSVRRAVRENSIYKSDTEVSMKL